MGPEPQGAAGACKSTLSVKQLLKGDPAWESKRFLALPVRRSCRRNAFVSGLDATGVPPPLDNGPRVPRKLVSGYGADRWTCLVG